jgi:hypothetical protein
MHDVVTGWLQVWLSQATVDRIKSSSGERSSRQNDSENYDLLATIYVTSQLEENAKLVEILIIGSPRTFADCGGPCIAS